jgi:hypothetical protein
MLGVGAITGTVLVGDATASGSTAANGFEPSFYKSPKI